MPENWPEFLNLVFGFGFFALVAAVALRPKWRAPKPVKDGPPDEPYRIYTTEFDIELRPKNILNDLILVSPDFARGQFNLEPDRGHELAQRFEAAVDKTAAKIEELHRQLSAEGIARHLEGATVALLLDQSGSMRGANSVLAITALKHFAGMLECWGVRTEVLGFSTVGWWGGRPYQKWKASGRPKRPGRLCATLNVVYKSAADEPMSPEAWRGMFDPNLYRENVDGEALQWALGRLIAQATRRKAIVIVSDGVPIDDATVMHNGVNYLLRHHQAVVAAIEARDDVALAAIGIDYRVDERYRFASLLQSVDDMPAALRYTVDKLAEHFAGQS